jgi:competence ComEA-like helix-hairpin-helix protein
VIAGEEPVPEVETEPSSDETGLELEQLGIDEEPDLVEELAAAADVDLEQVETEEITAEVDADQAATEEVSEEIPGWLSGLAEEQEAIAETEDVEWSPDMLTEEVDESIAPAEVEITEKIDLNAASLSQLEKIPGVGFIYAQNIVNHRAASGSFADLEQLNDVEGFTPEMVADMEQYLTVEVVADVSASESYIPEIQDAWDDIAAGNIDQAVEKYMDLINQDQHLDEVIRDLQSAVNKYPSDSGLYQCLGDAYMHSNMLQEALDAYNRAEDLI